MAAPQGDVLPELASVYWRPRITPHALHRYGQLWTATMVAHILPFTIVAAVLLALEPLSVPVAVAALVLGWVIPALYAQRGANVIRPRARAGEAAERTALGLLGDLVSHHVRDLHAQTGLVMERGELGVWLLGEAGALLVVPGAKRIHCFCVRVSDSELPSSDRIAHLLLALRSDETGFATVANRAFAGAPWRVRRCVPKPMRPAVARAVEAARADG